MRFGPKDFFEEPKNVATASSRRHERDFVARQSQAGRSGSFPRCDYDGGILGGWLLPALWDGIPGAWPGALASQRFL